MPSRRNRFDRWNSDWESYPPSRPLATEHGIATRKKRGAMAETWWSSRLVAVFESYGLGSRMQRGRRYARQGQLVSFDVQPGKVVARVQGSRHQPYAVRVTFPPLTDAQWRAVQHEIESSLQFAARLLAGEVPPELERVFDDTGVPLLPRRWTDLRATCSCPDWGDPCKHTAAVLYVLADRLDDDPWLLLRWRGREREELLAHLAAPSDGAVEVAPWWPLRPGAPLPVDDGTTDPWTDTDPSAVLLRLGPLAIDVHARPVTELLAAGYAALTDEPTGG